MNLKLAKKLRKLARCERPNTPTRYMLDLRKGKAFSMPGSVPFDGVGPVRPPVRLLTKVCDPRTTRGYYLHLKRIWK